jgi:hypothetical protein
MNWSRAICAIAILYIFLMFLPINGECSSITSDPPDESMEGAGGQTRHNIYVGAKVGLVYLLGIEMDYILQTRGVNRLYAAAALQSSFIVNSANIGGGVFLGKTGIGIGCRYHHLLWFESEKDSKIQPGYGPEVIYNKTIGTKYIINLHVGSIITEGSFFPDVTFGIFIPLN